jgi:Cyclic nucleotide-binding domain
MNEPTDQIAALAALPQFSGLDREDLQEVAVKGHPVRFPAGETIVERGDPGDALYIILSGAAEVDVGGRFHRIERGDFLGEMAVMAGKGRMATVVAREGCGDAPDLRPGLRDDPPRSAAGRCDHPEADRRAAPGGPGAHRRVDRGLVADG